MFLQSFLVVAPNTFSFSFCELCCLLKCLCWQLAPCVLLYLMLGGEWSAGLSCALLAFRWHSDSLPNLWTPEKRSWFPVYRWAWVWHQVFRTSPKIGGNTWLGHGGRIHSSLLWTFGTPADQTNTVLSDQTNIQYSHMSQTNTTTKYTPSNAYEL